MSTRSCVARVEKDGTIRSIYVHSDGYPEYVGQILQRFWTSRTKLARLLNHGNCSALGAQIGKQHDFEDWEAGGEKRIAREYAHSPRLQFRVSKWCRFYTRDRGDEDQQAHVSPDLKSLFAHWRDSGVEYIYILTAAGWFVWQIEEVNSAWAFVQVNNVSLAALLTVLAADPNEDSAARIGYAEAFWMARNDKLPVVIHESSIQAIADCNSLPDTQR